MGYTFLTPNPISKHPGGLTFAWYMWMLDATVTDVQTLLQPLDRTLNNSSYSKGISGQHFEKHSPSFYAFWTQSTAEAVGSNVRLGSRLLDKSALTKNVSYVKQKLQEALPIQSTLLGHLVAGKGVANAQPIGGAGSVLPAWRKAYYHLVSPVSWPFLNSTAAAIQSELLTHKYTEALREWAPDSGCYLNEADTNEPDLRPACWGEYYGRVLNIKDKYDPKGVFWCQPVSNI